MPALRKEGEDGTVAEPLPVTTGEVATRETTAPASTSTAAPNLVDLDLLLDLNPEPPAQDPGVAAAPNEVAAVAAPVATADALFDIFNSTPDVAPSAQPAAAAPVLNLFDSGPAPIIPSDPADLEFDEYKSAEPATLNIIAHEDEHLRVDFTSTKPDPSDPSTTSIDATVTNKVADTISDFNLLVAVPKHLKIALQTASSTVMQAGGTITQNMKITNSM
jgi:hypothetical protein